MNWTKVRRYLDCGEVWISGPGWTWHGWRWDVNIFTKMEFKWCTVGGDTRILGLECRWYRTWMEVRHKSWDLECIKIGPWMGWDSIYKTWNELRRHLDGVEKRIIWLGLGRDVIWVEVRWTSLNLEGCIWCQNAAEVQFWGPGLRWGAHLETCMHLRWCSDRGEMQICGPEWRWDITKMEVKRKSRALHWAETRPWMERC